MASRERPTTKASFLQGYCELVRELGADPDSLAPTPGFDMGRLGDPSRVLDYFTYSNLLDAAARATSCPHFGLLLGERHDLSIVGPLGLLAKHCATVGAALGTLSRYHSIHSQGAVYRLHRDGAVAFFIRESNVHSPNTWETSIKNPENYQRRVNSTPMGRMLTAEDIAPAFLFLASDDAAIVTGANLKADGGAAL